MNQLALLARARDLHERGDRQNLAGHPASARRTLERALRLADQAVAGQERDVVLARIWISLATSESELNGLAAGLATLDRAQTFVERANDPGLEVILQNQLGFMKARGGHLQTGLAHLDRAVTLIDHADLRIKLAVLLNRGTVHLFMGDLTRARPDLTEDADLARANGQTVAEIKARHNLGYLEFLAGNLALALRIMDDVLALALQTESSPAVSLLDRSRVLLEAGLHREADEALARAGELFRADRLWKDLGEVELARAECALLGDEIPAARRLAASARTRFRRRGNDRWRRDAELVLLQGDLAAGRPGSRLAPPALRLAAEFRAEGLPTQARTAALIAAEALLRAGRREHATEVARDAGGVRSGDPIGSRLHARVVRAKLALANGDGTAGRQEIRAGLSDLAQHRARFGSIDLQTASAVHGRQLAELDLSLALAEARPAGLLRSIEQSRAVSARLAAVVAPGDAEAAARLSELRQIAEELRSIESDPGAAPRVSAQRKRMAELQQELRSRSWQVEGSGQANKAATLEPTLAALADDGAAHVSYVEVAGQLHALALGAGRPRIVALGPARPVEELTRRVRADLDALASGTLPAALTAAVSSSLRRSIAALQSLIVEPLRVDVGRLVIAPTGTLATLPWGLLDAFQDCAVTVTPSTTSWLRSMQTPLRTGPADVAVFCGPDLAHAARETDGVSRSWPRASTFRGAEAGHAQFRSAMAEADIVHVAAHGQHQAENPLFSSIRLAGGPIYAYELDHTVRTAGHVVLSACELGQATIRPGDEALGLTSVLLRLGTRSVISGVARVNDEVAASVMIRYHQGLAAGLDSATALARAGRGDRELPAPFVCFGAVYRVTA